VRRTEIEKYNKKTQYDQFTLKDNEVNKDFFKYPIFHNEASGGWASKPHENK
jgi:hypothetical protein